MSGRPRTTSFAEGNKQPLNPPLGGMKISSKCVFVRLLTSDDVRRNLAAAVRLVTVPLACAAVACNMAAVWPWLWPLELRNCRAGRGCRPHGSCCCRRYKRLKQTSSLIIRSIIYACFTKRQFRTLCFTLMFDSVPAIQKGYLRTLIDLLEGLEKGFYKKSRQVDRCCYRKLQTI